MNKTIALIAPKGSGKETIVRALAFKAAKAGWSTIELTDEKDNIAKLEIGRNNKVLIIVTNWKEALLDDLLRLTTSLQEANVSTNVIVTASHRTDLYHLDGLFHFDSIIDETATQTPIGFNIATKMDLECLRGIKHDGSAILNESTKLLHEVFERIRTLSSYTLNDLGHNYLKAISDVAHDLPTKLAIIQKDGRMSATNGIWLDKTLADIDKLLAVDINKLVIEEKKDILLNQPLEDLLTNIAQAPTEASVTAQDKRVAKSIILAVAVGAAFLAGNIIGKQNVPLVQPQPASQLALPHANSATTQTLRETLKLPEAVSLIPTHQDTPWRDTLGFLIAGREHILWNTATNQIMAGQLLNINPDGTRTNITTQYQLEAKRNRMETAVKTFREKKAKIDAITQDLSQQGPDCKIGHLYLFTSPTCPHCQELESIIAASDKNLYITHIPTAPVSDDPTSQLVTRILCAPNKTQAYTDVLTRNKKINDLPACDKPEQLAAAQATQAELANLANELGVDGFPSVFIAYKNGDITYDEGFTDRIKSVLKGESVNAELYEKGPGTNDAK